MKIKSLIKHNLMRAAMTLLVMLPWAANAQTRECNPITTYPWTENFDSYTGTTSGSTNNLPECWNYINTCTHNSYKGYPVVYGANYTSGHSGHNFLYFESYYQYDPKPQYAILPKMSGLAGKHITLWAMGNLANSTCTFKIGTMSDPADASTFGAFAEQELSDYSLGLGWQEYAFTVPTGTTNTYLAILMEPAPSSNQNNKWISIDDIAVFDDFSQTGDNEYTIFTAAGWGLFCDAIAGGESFSGKTVKLGADITITRMACDENHKFNGTFNGQGHTLTVNYGSADNPIDTEFVAPFVCSGGNPVFINLNIDGHIYSTYTCNNPEPHSAHTGTGGLIGHLYGTVTIEHCMSNVEITVTGEQYASGFVGLCEHTVNFNDCMSSAVIHSAGGNNSGFVAWSRASGWNINFTGCVFNGKLLQINGQGNSNGGFIGWTGSNKTVTITNCLYAPAALAEGEAYASYNSATFARGWQEHCSETNSYYTTALGDAQGTQAYSITAGDYVTTLANAGTVSNNYTTSGLIFYNVGLKYGDVLYAASNDEVSLTLGCTLPEGYVFNGYTVSPTEASLTGNDNDGYTLTMPNGNVTINATLTPIIRYIDEYGETQQCTEFTVLTGNETTLGTSGQETWYVADGTLDYSQTINLNGNVHLILKDNAVMNVGTEETPINGRGIDGSDHFIRIYGQSTGDHIGTLSVYTARYNCNGIRTNNLTINGGHVIANTNGGSSNALYAYNGDVVINGGIVEATATDAVEYAHAIYATYNFTYTGGIVEANAASGYAINAGWGQQYTFTWRNPSDRITIGSTGLYNNSGNATATFTNAFTDGTNIYSGTLTGTEAISGLAGKTLYPYIEGSVPYIDENGQRQLCIEYNVLNGTETTLGTSGQEKWCVVQGTLNYSHGIQLLGNTHIILCDGAAMNIGTSDNPVSGTSSYQENVGFYGGETFNLSLYAQSGNTGTLTIYSNKMSFLCQCLTLAGGNVNTTTVTDSPVIACSNNLTVRRSALEIHTNGPAVQANDVALSNVTANINSSNNVGFSCSNFAVDHSQLTVTALYQAIQASNVITLGCTAATDFIKATNTSSSTLSYMGTVKIADGQTLYAGTNTYTGTLTDEQRQAIGGQKLTNVAPPTYDYIGLDGTGATHTAEVIDADNMPTGLSGWYIVQGTVNYTNTIDLAGDTHIILADNAVMNVTVTDGNHGIRSVSGNNYPLFVYGQTGQSGELNVTSNSIACFISGGDITIAGGKVTASGETGIHTGYNNNGGNVTIKNATVTVTAAAGNAAIYSNNGSITIDNSNVTATGGFGIEAISSSVTINGGQVTTTGNYGIYTENGSVTINSGQVMATGNYGIYTIGSVTINGGQVRATGNNYGIYAQNSSDNITLGWTNPTDFIYVNKYDTYGTLSIADGKAFIDEDGNTYSGPVAMVSGAYPIDGKRLYPYSENAVPYLNENGQQRYCVAYTTLTGTEAELGAEGQETWCVVQGTLNYSEGIQLLGNTHIILVDGKTMTITSSYGDGIDVDGSLTIYGQELGTGTLNATGSDGIYSYNGSITIIGGTVNATGNDSRGIYSSGGITISGGTLNATGNENGIHSYSGNITISGGTVTATGNNIGIFTHSGNITISGGRVTATSNNGHGIYSYDGTTTLGWTNATDFNYVSRYYIGISGTLNIAEGKTFIDEAGNTFESGSVEASAINGKWLYPNTVSRFTKTIAAHHTEEGVNYGWYLIASPLSGGTNAEAVAHLVNSKTPANFDLYRFNQSADLEWENWKQQNSDHYHFNLEPGRGYLYANAADVNLVFAGMPYSGNGEVTITNVAGHPLSGWNLVGNPFEVGATLSQPYYRMNAEGTALNTSTENTAVAAMEGVFVQANQDSQTVTFTAQTRGGEKAAIAQANIMVGGNNGAVIDNAIIRFDGGQTLEKFSFREGSTKIYIPQDGTDYAIVTSESQGEMPLNFKAEENGTYTISVNVDHVELAYLHLIDNLTGADVDLLAPNGGDARHGDARPCVSTYTFTAKTTDYESRFKLVFAVGSSAGSDTFAFFSNGNIIVNGEGTLQIIDILGRQLSSQEIHSTFSIQHSTFPTSGVYVLRLINGEHVRTQKIVVELF